MATFDRLLLAVTTLALGPVAACDARPASSTAQGSEKAAEDRAADRKAEGASATRAHTAPALPPEPTPPAAAPPAAAPLPEGPERVEASFRAVSQSLRGSLSGQVRFERVQDGVRVDVDVTGLPKGDKAVHIHERADCSDPKSNSMGSHFAPEAQTHGLPDSANHHRGDLGNLRIGKDGSGKLQWVITRVSLDREGASSLLGRAVVIRSKADDGLQETIGKPLACAALEAPP